MLEYVERLFFSVLLRVWAQACIRRLDSYVRRSIFAYAGLFLRLCVRGDGLAYMGSYLRM